MIGRFCGQEEYSQIGKNQFAELDRELGLKVGTMADRMKHSDQNIKDDLAKNMTENFAY